MNILEAPNGNIVRWECDVYLSELDTNSKHQILVDIINNKVTGEFPVIGGEGTITWEILNPKGVCISLFHGRNTPNEILEDWGFDGAVIMNVGYATTYNTVKIFDILPDGSFGDMVILNKINDLILLDSKYYGDLEICSPTSHIATNPDRTKLTFLQLKEIVERDNQITHTNHKADALKAVLEYSMPEERKALVEHLYDEVDKEEDFENMSDEDLYNYCAYNNVSHIWCHFYLLSI